MQINFKNMDTHELIKKAITVVVILILILLTTIGVLTSEFTKINKFDSSGKSPRQLSNFKQKDRLYNPEVTVSTSSNMANLGDFTFNIGDDKKLIANISLKYKSNKKASWFDGDKEIEQEFIKKSVILRNAAINTMIENQDASADSKKMRRELKNSINKELYTTQVEEVYFNKFITQ